MKIKRILSALLALALVPGCLAGCGKKTVLEAEEAALMPSVSTAATGRYVEKELELPPCRYAKDLVMLTDGRLRIALEEENGNILICTSDESRSGWAAKVSLPEQIVSQNVESVALSPDGRVP